jgi:hypothetical protein
MLCFNCFWMFFRHVASLCFKCFSYFRCMSQLFHADVVKVDGDATYISMVVHVCCKHLFPMFHLFLYAYVASVSDACLKCCICILLYVASVASGCFKSRLWCCTCCNGVLTVCPKCIICFICLLQKFYLDVTKLDLVFDCCSGTHLSQPPACCCWAHVHACGSRGARATGAGNESGHGARRGPAHEHCTGRSGVGSHVKKA